MNRSALATHPVLVVGDVMLDRYWFGEVDRISPEAPVPVVRVQQTEERLGGAANVARNVVAAGGRAGLLAVIGDDDAGSALLRLAAAAGVRTHISVDRQLTTTVKVRVIGRRQQIVRVDFDHAPAIELLATHLDQFEQLLRQYQLVVLSDYGKGGLAHIEKMVQVARSAGKSILIDPKGDDYSRYAGATVITPNRAELREVVGRWKDEADLERRAQELRRRLSVPALLLTRSEEGMTLFTDEGAWSVPAQAREVYDVSGAGDTVIGVLAMMLASGASLKEAVATANRAGGIVVGKLGTSTVSYEELFPAMNVIVTGAAGFVGSNNVHALNARGERNVIAVDSLKRAEKFVNLVGAEIGDYIDKQEFLDLVRRHALPKPDIVFHQGACSDTMESDGRYMMENNYRYSVELFRWCQELRVPLVYASSGAVYGLGPVFKEDRALEHPLNVYGYSKFLFDQYIRRALPDLRAPVIGLRYFNVYGPRESHKGRMASVAYHHVQQFRAEGAVELFEGSHGYADGDQRRDFVHVDDVIATNLHFWDHPVSGVYNVGTGRAQAFNDVARAVVNTIRAIQGKAPLSLQQLVAAGEIKYVPFPAALLGKYQAYTQADRTSLDRAGMSAPFRTVEVGTAEYVRWLLAR